MLSSDFSVLLFEQQDWTEQCSKHCRSYRGLNKHEGVKAYKYINPLTHNFAILDILEMLYRHFEDICFFKFRLLFKSAATKWVISDKEFFLNNAEKIKQKGRWRRGTLKTDTYIKPKGPNNSLLELVQAVVDPLPSFSFNQRFS